MPGSPKVASRAPPPDFWPLMPSRLMVVAPDAATRARLEAALTPALLANCYSFVLEVGSMPDCLLQLFTAAPPNRGTLSFLLKVGSESIWQVCRSRPFFYISCSGSGSGQISAPASTPPPTLKHVILT